jgi:hypothetical protein
MTIRLSRRTIATVLICVAAGFAALSIQYVHSGYLGVVDGSSPSRLLDRGLHLRAPWQRVIFYPTQGGSVGIATESSGPSGTMRAEVTVVLSVRPDSVESLHRAYRGQYLQALVVPAVNEFLSLRADTWADWQDQSVANTIDGDLAAYLNATLSKHGVAVFQTWVESFDVTPGSLK